MCIRRMKCILLIKLIYCRIELIIGYSKWHCYTFVINLLYICYSFVIHLLYICYTFVIHLLYICYTFVIHLLYICYTFVISGMLHVLKSRCPVRYILYKLHMIIIIMSNVYNI